MSRRTVSDALGMGTETLGTGQGWGHQEQDGDRDTGGRAGSPQWGPVAQCSKAPWESGGMGTNGDDAGAGL